MRQDYWREVELACTDHIMQAVSLAVEIKGLCPMGLRAVVSCVIRYIQQEQGSSRWLRELADEIDADTRRRAN